MDKKYEITTTPHPTIPKLFQIKALRDFGIVKAGELGGYIEREDNLSHEGNCWVFDAAKAYGYARVIDNALVADFAEVYGAAWVCDDAVVSEYAKVYGDAYVRNEGKVNGRAEIYNCARVIDKAKVYGRNTKVYGNAQICGNAKVAGDANVYGLAMVTGGARVDGRAKIFDTAKVYGDAYVIGDAVICQSFHVGTGTVDKDLTKDLAANIKAQTTLYPAGGKVVCYKYVNKDFTSLYDKNFVYKVGEWVEEPNTNLDPTHSCAPGLHFSHASYWDHQHTTDDGRIIIACEVKLEDIICVQDGKIRAKKCFVIGT